MFQRKTVFAVIFGLVCFFNAPQAFCATVIHTCAELQAMQNDLNGDYVLAGNIDCSDTKNWNGGAGFVPIGVTNVFTGFKGNLDGQGHKVKDLYINSSIGLGTTSVSVGTAGLFNVIMAGSVKNIALENVYVKSNEGAGGLAGSIYYHGAHTITIDHVSVSGNIIGNVCSGGLIGETYGANISNSATHVTVKSQGNSWGLGGLVGCLRGTIQKSSSSGEVIGEGHIGGLVGFASGSLSTITDSYSNAKVTLKAPTMSLNFVGGLMGDAYNAGNVINTYAVGNVGIGTSSGPGFFQLGGLIGRNLNTSVISSVWDKNTTQRLTSSGSPNSDGHTTAELQNASSFLPWDFNNTWLAQTNPQGYPVLRWQLEPAASLWKTFNELSRQNELLTALLPTDLNLQRSTVNWSNLSIPNSLGMNWADAAVLSRPLYWDDADVSVYAVNWSNLEVLSKSNLNWPDVVTISTNKINWASVNPVVKAGVNWLDWESMTKSTINWANVKTMSTKSINWTNLSIKDKAATNWMDWSALTRNSVNWVDVARISKAGINWNGLGTLNANINWMGLKTLTTKGVNWTNLSDVSYQGVNWSDPKFLSTLNLTPSNLKTLRTIGNTSHSQSTVGGPNHLPEIVPIVNQIVNEGQWLSIYVEATDADEDALTYSVTNLPAGALFYPGSYAFYWQPAFDQAGTYTVTFSVSDGNGSVSTSTDITVINVPAPDLVITALFTPTAISSPGMAVSVALTVKNQGASAASVTKLGFHLSQDAVYGGADDIAITYSPSVNSLGIGMTQNVAGNDLAVPATAPAGNYYLCAFSDSPEWVAEENESNNSSCTSTTIQVSLLTPADTTAPSIPTNLTAQAVSTTQIDLAWSASTDNVGVTGYQVFRNGVLIASPTGTSYSSAGLLPATAYSFTVKAMDAAGNISAVSNTASATTFIGSIAVGSRVQVISPTIIRSAPSAKLTGITQPVGALGTVIGGPAVADGATWWNVNFDTGADGWTWGPKLKSAS